MRKFNKPVDRNLKILIPNATGPTNIGDQAILTGLLNLIKANIKKPDITIHSSNPELYKNPTDYKVKHTLYSWTVFENTKAFSRIVRLLRLLVYYIFKRLRFDSVFILNKDKILYGLVDDFKKANLVIFVGGGYLRSKKGISQSLNLLMQLFMINFAKLFNTKRIVAPISFGPFGYKWQEKFAAETLKNLDLVSVREEISYNIINKYKVENLILSSDHALLIKEKNNQSHKKGEVLGFTVKNWFDKEKQEYFENSLVKAIRKIALSKNLLIQPTVQVNASYKLENDMEATNRVIRKLRKLKIKVLKKIVIKDLNNALETYSNIDILLGMRMHSNILAALRNKPFAAISYEHKTEGLMKQFDLENYCIKSENVNKNNLSELLEKLYRNKNLLKKKISNSLKKIQSEESSRWVSILSNMSI